MQARSRHPEIGVDDSLVVSIAALVRAGLGREAAAGFPTLSCIPSSGIVKLLAYPATLSEAERTALLDAHACLAALHFFPGPLIGVAYEQCAPASQPWCAAALLCSRVPSSSGCATLACG